LSTSRAIRTELTEVRQEQREQRITLSGLERGSVNLFSEITEMGLPLDRMHDQIDRIERRLGLVED
jgi:hypothetical protein